MQTGVLVGRGRPPRAVVGALVGALTCLCLLVPRTAAAAGDLPPALVAIIDGIFTPPNPFTAADVVAEIRDSAAGGTPTSTPSASATPTPTGTVTRTPTATQTGTPRPCPLKTVSLRIEVDNQTGISPASVRLSGTREDDACTGGIGLTAYDVVVDCAQGVSSCATVNGLRPGTWIHSVAVVAPASGQQQYRPSLLVAGTAEQVMHHTLFQTVSNVTTTADQGAGSLRSLIQAAGAALKPMLIQFDPAVFPPGVPTTIVLRSAPPNLTASDVTIDGIDSTGASGNRIVDANGQTNPAMTVSGGRNHLIGLRLRNAGGNDRDVLSIAGAQAVSNLVESCIVDTAATADAVGIDQQAGGQAFETANVVRDCEIFGAADKGVKVTTGAFALVQNTWVHDNRNGGLQAALGGHLQAFENLVENNRGATAQNGIAVLGSDDNGGEVSFSTLETRGNISRRNGASGLAVRVGASAKVNDDYLAQNGTSGIRVFNDVGPAATASVQGTTAACNGGDGGVVANTSLADFGAGPFSSPGNNAFTQNNLPAGFDNFRNVTATQISAVNAQWEHCGREATCNDEEIRRLDLNDNGIDTLIAPAQAHRNLQPVITSVSPAKGRQGDLVRIYGSGFNVIDGHFAEDRCSDVVGRNTCVPVRGNCVQINGAAAQVEAVTPTMLIARLPFTCTEPVALIVKVDQGPGVVTSLPFTVCE